MTLTRCETSSCGPSQHRRAATDQRELHPHTWVATAGLVPVAAGPDRRGVKRRTGRLRQLTHNDDDDAYPAYPPDGSKIAFISDRTGVRQVWVMDVDRSDPVQLTVDGCRQVTAADMSTDERVVGFGTRVPACQPRRVSD